MNALLNFLEKLLTWVFSLAFGALIVFGLMRWAKSGFEEEDPWRHVKKTGTLEAYRGYVRECPACPHRAEAEQRLDELLRERGFVARLDLAQMPERASIGSPVLSPDGRTVLASVGTRPAFWDAETGKFLLRDPVSFQMRDRFNIETLAYSADGSRVAAGTSGGEGGRLYVWDERSGKRLAEHLVEEYDIKFVEFAPDGALVGWLAQGPVGVWEPATNKFLRAAHEGASALAFLRDEKKRLWLLSASGREVWSWDSGTLELGRQVRINSDRELLGLSRDGLLIAYIEGPILELWDTRSALAVATLPDHDGEVVSFCREPDRGRVAVGTKTGTLYLWDPAAHKLLGKVPAHEGPVERITCAGRGRAVSAGWDGAVVWDLEKLARSSRPPAPK